MAVTMRQPAGTVKGLESRAFSATTAGPPMVKHS